MTYRLGAPLAPVLHCHCENCRRTTGNFVAACQIPTDDLHLDDPDAHLRWYDLGYAAYGFCTGCGATLFWRGAEHPETTSVMTGTLDQADDLALAAVWFAGEAQPHHRLPLDVAHHEGNA